MRATKVFTALAAALALLLVATAPAGASHSWSTYHWARTANPFTLELVDTMTTSWDGFLGAVSTDWTASTVLDTTIVTGSDAFKDRKQCKAALGKIKACNATYGFNGWLGLATIWISGGHIVQGTSKVNDTYFGTSFYNNDNARRHVLCQEVGHTFGLGHQTAVSCMDDQNGLFDAAYVSPNAHDYEQLETIYNSHVESSAPSGGASLGQGADDDALPPGAGPQHGNVFVKDLGNGRLIVTHVFWVHPGR